MRAGGPVWAERGLVLVGPVAGSQSVVVSYCDIDVSRYYNFNNKEEALEAVYKYCE